MNKSKEKNRFLWSIIIFSVITILPLLILSLYNHPSADDFAYAVDTHRAWKDTRNLLQVLRAAIDTACGYWHRWQGTYTSAILMSLEPGIFGEQYYRITGFLTIGSIITGNLVFSIYILHKRLGEKKLTSAAFGMILSFLMLHWMPSTVEGLYWYNGSMHYTFFFGVLMVFSCLVIDLCKEEKKIKMIVKTVIGTVLAFVLSGGNYVTGFGGILVMLLCLGICIFYRKKTNIISLAVIFLFEMAGFLLNILCPGTAIRSSAFDENRSILGTVWKSAAYVIGRVDRWIGLALIVSVIIMLPYILQCVRRIRRERGFGFKNPLLVFVLSIGFLAAMCCPSYYAMGAIGAGRLVNVIYFAFVLLFMMNAFYVLGWLDQKFEFKAFLWDFKWSLTVMVLVFGMIVGCYGNSAGYLAWQSIESGEALAYSLEADARYNLYVNSAGKDVEVAPFSFYPQLLYYEDITEDSEDWRNQQVREYYELNSVVRR